MDAQTRRRLALQVTAATYGGLCCLIALVSWLDTYNPGVRALIDGFKGRLVSAHLAGQGHCWLCGMSHAFRALWRGEFATAVRYNSHSAILFSLMAGGCVFAAAIVLSLIRSNQQHRRVYSNA